MDIETYMIESQRTVAPIRQEVISRASGCIGITHASLGISTESGELLDALKKHIFYGKELDLVNVSEEIGDLLWYIADLCRICGFDLESIMEQNIAKLWARYPEKFTEENATVRDLETERHVLESDQ